MSDEIEIRYGLSAEVIAKIEQELPNLDVDTVIERMDAIFNKGWSYEYEGPHLVEIPVKPPVSPGSKSSPRPKLVAHWQCLCTVSIIDSASNFETTYSRDYTMLVEAEPGAFEVVRDLTLIYALVKRFGLGKRGTCPLPVIEDYKPAPEPPAVIYEDYQLALAELQEIKAGLGIKKNTELDSYVRDCFDGRLTTYRQIGKANVRAFVDYLKVLLNGESPPRR